MPATLDTLPPELILQILSHLSPIHYFPLKVVGSHYLRQIVQNHFPRMCEAEWEALLRPERWHRKIHALHMNYDEERSLRQGRSSYVEKLIERIEDAKKRPITDEIKGDFAHLIVRFVKKRRLLKLREVAERRRKTNIRSLELTLLSALCVSASVNSEYILRLILEKGMLKDIDSGEYDWKNALHGAVSNGHAECARLLLRYGASCEVRGRDGKMVFHVAAENSDAEMMRVLLEEGRLFDNEGEALLDALSALETSALSVATAECDIVMMKLLLDAGARINPNGDWFIVMITAAKAGDADAMELLLKHFGQEVQLTPGLEKPNLWRVVDAAAASGFSHVIEKILDSEFEYMKNPQEESYITPLHIAASEDRVEVVRLFLDRRLYVDICTPGGLTPIQTAVYYNNLDALLAFVDRGYSIDSQDEHSNGTTLIHVLAESPYFTNASVLSYLVDSGLDLHAKVGDHQLTPMHYAFGAQLPPAVRFLRDAGADMNARGLHGQTPLMTVLCQPELDSDKLSRLMNFETNMDLADDYGNRAIHMAVYYGKDASSWDGAIENTNALMRYGADPNVKNDAGQAAIHIAAQQNNFHLVNTLLRYCADANARDNKLMTPLHYLRIGVDVGGSLAEIKLRAAWGEMDAKNSKGKTPAEMVGQKEEKIVMPYEPFIRPQWKGLKRRALYDPPRWVVFVKSLRDTPS